jgi:hypothetical protein
MMNQWTGHCAIGETFRDTCPILSENLPDCVEIEYSFWVCDDARPFTINQCDQAYVDGFCSEWTSYQVVAMCNGDSWILESVPTGFGEQQAFTADKNGYGLEMSLEYVWLNAGHGEDRRRIETGFTDWVWLCNAQMDPDQATVVKYRIRSIGGGADGDDLSFAYAVRPSTCIQVLMVLAPLIFLAYFLVEDAIDHVGQTLADILGCSPSMNWQGLQGK